MMPAAQVLGEERVHRLCWSAAYEVRQRVYDLRPLDVQRGREGQREDALDDHVRDGRQRPGERTPQLDDAREVGVAGVPGAVQRERAHAARMAGGQVHAHGGPEGDARDVHLLDPDGAQERGDLIGVALGRVRPGGLVALARAGKVDRDTAEVLGVRRQLEGVAGVVGGQVGNQQQRLALALYVVVVIVSPSTSTRGMLAPS